MPRQRTINAQRLLGYALTLALCGSLQPRAAGQMLYEQEPFDTLVLDQASDGVEMRTQPLDLPGRRVPNPLPSGAVTVRLIDDPGTPVVVDWNSVDRVILFEQRLYEESQRAMGARELDLAYGCLARLQRDYPNYGGLSRAQVAFLRADAFDKFRQKKYDHALAVLQVLHELDPRARGVQQAIETVSEEILENAWGEKDYASLGSAIASIESLFPDLELATSGAWRERLQGQYQTILAEASLALAEGDHQKARRLALEAQALLPNETRAQQVLDRVREAYPILRVGVLGADEPAQTPRIDAPNARRLARLMGGSLANLDDYGPNGGVYTSPLGRLASDNSGKQVTIEFARGVPQSPYDAARVLLDTCASGDPAFGALAGRADRVSVERPATLSITLKRSHPKPESLLKGPMPAALSHFATTSWVSAGPTAHGDLYRRPPEDARQGDIELIEEVRFAEDRDAVAALLSGEIDLLANPPPWQVRRLKNASDIRVGQYRTPTLHCLLLSDTTRLRRSREARRAFCYGLARAEFVQTTLLAGAMEPGFQALSGPFPAGESLSDPLRYAYHEGLPLRSHQPRLAAVLGAVAEQESLEAGGDVEAAPLVLIHAPLPIARVSCRSIQSSMASLGVAIELVEIPERRLIGDPPPHDLRYAQLAVDEPMIDVWPLLGPGGVSGDCSESMMILLPELHVASSTIDMSDALKQVHELVYGDLPLIPLWQTVDHYAFRTELAGVPDQSVELYQSVDRWRRTNGGTP